MEPTRYFQSVNIVRPKQLKFYSSPNQECLKEADTVDPRLECLLCAACMQPDLDLQWSQSQLWLKGL